MSRACSGITGSLVRREVLWRQLWAEAGGQLHFWGCGVAARRASGTGCRGELEGQPSQEAERDGSSHTRHPPPSAVPPRALITWACALPAWAHSRG